MQMIPDHDEWYLVLHLRLFESMERRKSAVFLLVNGAADFLFVAKC